MAAKQVQSFRSVGRKRNKGENPSIQELVPIKKMIRGNVVKKNGRCLSFLKVTTRNINGLSASEQYQAMRHFENMLRIYEEEMSILSMMFPTNIDDNLVYWNRQLQLAREERNPVRARIIREQISRLVWVEQELSNLEFYFIVYGKTEKELNLSKTILKRAGGSNLGIKDIPPKQIEQILIKLNNLNTPI